MSSNLSAREATFETVRAGRTISCATGADEVVTVAWACTVGRIIGRRAGACTSIFGGGANSFPVERARSMSEVPSSSSDKLDTLMRMLESQKTQTSKILLKAAGRLFLVSEKDICFASIEDGIITVVTGGPNGMEGQSNCRTLEELLDSLDPNLFWRAHRSYLVNTNRIREVVPWFKSSYQLRMDDKKQTEIPVSRAQTKRLRELFGL